MTTTDDGKGPRCLLIGSGRGGTQYMKILLTAAGLPCSHEGTSATHDKMKGWRDCSWYAVPVAPKAIEDAKLIHLVRNPLHVISSQYRYKWLRDDTSLPATTLIKAVPEIKSYKDLLDRTVVGYIGWNQHLLFLSGHENYRRHRVEDDPDELLLWLGAKPEDLQTEEFKKARTNTSCNGGRWGAEEYLKLADIREPFRTQLSWLMHLFGYTT